MKQSKNQVLEFNYSQARTITRPLYFYGADEGKETLIKTHFLFIMLKNLPLNIPTTPNPRQANLNAKPCKQMFETLETEPEYFTDCNRGLFLLAEKVHFPKDDGEVKKAVINFGRDEEGFIRGGLVDGGHTLAVLKKIAEDETLAELPIFVTIIEGAEDFATKLARARNTSVQVTDMSIANLADEFEGIKEALGKYSNKVIYSENENIIKADAVFPIEELIALMTALNRDLYDTDSQPTVAYTGIRTCFNKWYNKNNRQSYEKLYHLLPSIVEIYEYLYGKFEDYAKKGIGIKKFGLINGVERYRGKGKNRKKISIRLPFTNQIVSYRLAKGFIMPVFASLRFILKEQNGKYEWATDPKKFLDKYSPKLVGKVLTAHTNDYGSNPNKTGKSKVLWENIATTVVNYSLQEQLRKKE